MRNLPISVVTLELAGVDPEVLADMEVVKVMLYMMKVNMVSMTVVNVNVVYMTIFDKRSSTFNHGCAGSVEVIDHGC